VLRFLAAGPAAVERGAESGVVLLQARDGRGAIGVAGAVLERLAGEGLLVREGGAVRLGTSTDEGRGDALGAARQVLEAASAGGDGPALVNAAESPLALLARRKAKNGAAFLTGAEFAAGERLRADFSRGSLMPRLGANWVASVASGRRHGGGIGDLTDAALGARVRVEKALDAVGPELAGVLVDVCCFLKGLEQVESERGWPVRSAKVVLKSGLAALARHYDPGAGRRRAALHWGTEDYRPKIR
jgi:hypothetical protein